MYKIPQSWLKIVKTKEKILKFVPYPGVVTFILQDYAAKGNFTDIKISILCYISRHVKQIGCQDITILIPRIIVRARDGIRQIVQTHVLLPDFLMPFTRHTIKSKTMCFMNRMHETVVAKVSRRDLHWSEHLTDCVKACAGVVKYIKNRIGVMHSRFMQFVTLPLTVNNSLERYICKKNFFAKRFYLFFENQQIINPVLYQTYTL